MNVPSLSSETLHASCIAIRKRAILISGRSGSGKSDLALRLIDRGARLVSDDYTIVRRLEGRLVASAPPNIVGKLEVRGLGILSFEDVKSAPVCLLVDLNRDIERLPDSPEPITIAGMKVPVIGIRALEASAPMKVEMALAKFGLAVE